MSKTVKYKVVVSLPGLLKATVSKIIELDLEDDETEVDQDTLEEACRDAMFDLISWDYKKVE